MTSSRALCLYGAGGHGRVVARQAVQAGWQNVSFGDDFVKIGATVAGFPMIYSAVADIGSEALLVCIGDNAIRQETQRRAVEAGLYIETLIVDPQRYFGQPPGKGTVVLAGSVVNDNATLGAGVIVNSSAVVEHDVKVGNFAHIAPGAILGGGSSVGDRSLIGTNATVLPMVKVNNDIVVGAGAVVTMNLEEPGVYAGVPARKLGDVELKE